MRKMSGPVKRNAKDLFMPGVILLLVTGFLMGVFRAFKGASATLLQPVTDVAAERRTPDLLLYVSHLFRRTCVGGEKDMGQGSGADAPALDVCRRGRYDALGVRR